MHFYSPSFMTLSTRILPRSFKAITFSLIQVRDILSGKMKGEELKFYENLEAVAKAAKAGTLRREDRLAAKALKEVLAGLAKDACTWVTENANQHTQGSGFGETSVDCDNVTDILRFARQQETDFLVREMSNPPFGYDALSLSLRLRPVVTEMLSYLRSKSSRLQPGSPGERQAWVVRQISPRNHCFVCTSL